MAKVMDEDTLKYIMESVTTNDRQLQRRLLDQYVTDDVKFTHFLGDVQGREAMYGVYRAAATGINYKLKFIEMVTSEELAAVWVDLNIKLPPFYLVRYHAPTIVILRFRRCEDGLLRICEQIDHHSIFVFMWALGWPFSTLWDVVIRKVQGSILCSSGWAIDAMEDIARYLFNQGLKTTGWVLASALPEPMLQSISKTLGTVLPRDVAQQLGFSGQSGIRGVPKDAADDGGQLKQHFESANLTSSSSSGSRMDNLLLSSGDTRSLQYNGAGTVLPGGTMGQYNGVQVATALSGGTTAALDEAAGSSTSADAASATAKTAPIASAKPLEKAQEGAAPFPSVVAAAAAAEGKPTPGAPATPTASAETFDTFRSSSGTAKGRLDTPDQADHPSAAAETLDKPDQTVVPALHDSEALAASAAAANETLKALAEAAGEGTAAEAEVFANAAESLTAMTATIAVEEPSAAGPTATVAATEEKLSHAADKAVGNTTWDTGSDRKPTADTAAATTDIAAPVTVPQPNPAAVDMGRGTVLSEHKPAPSVPTASVTAAVPITAAAERTNGKEAEDNAPASAPTMATTANNTSGKQAEDKAPAATVNASSSQGGVAAAANAEPKAAAASSRPSGPSRQGSKKKKSGEISKHTFMLC